MAHWRCSTNTDRWIDRGTLQISPWDDDTSSYIEIDSSTAYQEIDGFGGCFNELGWDALSALSRTERDEVMKALFDPNTGCRFNICRIPVGASDYAMDYYSLDDHAGDFAMDHFSVDRDRERLFPYVEAAMVYKPDLKIWGSPWTPPEWMKTNQNYSGGRMMQAPQYLTAYALYLAKAVQAFQREGLNFYALHVQNEPSMPNGFPSCVWDGNELRDFIKNYLGPRFRDDKINAEIWLGTINETDFNSTAGIVLSDPTANMFIAGVGFQWNGKYAIQPCHDQYPDKRLMQTETECGWHQNDWNYARETFDLMKTYFDHWANSYMQWNMVLDQTGLSSWGWAQNSMISVDKNTQAVTYNPQYYCAKHFSYYIKPGAHRIQSGGNYGDQIAFKNPDGEMVLVVLNKNNTDLAVALKFGDQKVKPVVPANSINTFVMSSDSSPPVVVDGLKDGFYSTLTGPENGHVRIPAATANDNGAPADDQDLSADLWVAWDDTYLYVYEEVRDDAVHLNNPTTWQNDCLEIYFDPDPSLGRTSGPPGFGLSALDSTDTDPANYSGVASMNAFSTFLATKADYARRKTEDGYALECRVKWEWIRMTGWGPVVPGAGKVFGMAVMNHDNDASGREGSIEWSAALKDAVWNDTRLHGTVTFLDGHQLKLEARNAIIDTVVNPLAALYVPSGLPWPMLSMDIGPVQKTGSALYDAATEMYTVSGSGADIWGQADGFRYAFRQVSGDADVTVKIESLTKSDPWTKAGVMIRDELTPGSAHAIMMITSDNGLAFQYRTRKDTATVNASVSNPFKPPYWLKLVRFGNTLIGAASNNGLAWYEWGRKELPDIQDPFYAGMAVTAHNDSSISTAEFSDVTFDFTDVTGVEEMTASAFASQGFMLSQNYPNPFNPVTRLSYDLPRQARVKIVITDLMGHEVATLVNGMKPAGRHTIEFDASGLGSGIYFYRMFYDGQYITRKMMLLK